MKPRYKLTLEVHEEDGQRVFTVENTLDSQTDMARSFAFDIARAIEATFMAPPSAMDITGAMEHCNFSVEEGLAIAYEKWDGETDFSKCVSIEVDMDVLMSTYEKDEIAYAKKRLEQCGIVCKLKEPTTETATPEPH